MGYQETKIKAYKEIREMAEKGETIEDIQFTILTKYGVGERVVNSYYEMLRKRDLVK